MPPCSRLSLLLLNMALMATPSAPASVISPRMKRLRTWCLTQPGRWWDGEQTNPKACPELAPHYKCG